MTVAQSIAAARIKSINVINHLKHHAVLLDMPAVCNSFGDDFLAGG